MTPTPHSSFALFRFSIFGAFFHFHLAGNVLLFSSAVPLPGHAGHPCWNLFHGYETGRVEASRGRLLPKDAALSLGQPNGSGSLHRKSAWAGGVYSGKTWFAKLCTATFIPMSSVQVSGSTPWQDHSVINVAFPTRSEPSSAKSAGRRCPRLTLHLALRPLHLRRSLLNLSPHTLHLPVRPTSP